MKKIDIYIKNTSGKLDLFTSVFYDEESFDEESFNKFLNMLNCNMFENFNDYNIKKLLQFIEENNVSFSNDCMMYK